MNITSTVLRGEIAGRRAEVRLEERVVRVQVLTLVSQQPGLDISVPIADLLSFRVRSKPQWLFGILLFGVGAYVAYGSGAPADVRDSIAVFFGVLGAVGLALGFFFPITWLEIADREHAVVVQLSRFSRSHARRLVEAVHTLNPALTT